MVYLEQSSLKENIVKIEIGRLTKCVKKYIEMNKKWKDQPKNMLLQIYCYKLNLRIRLTTLY